MLTLLHCFLLGFSASSFVPLKICLPMVWAMKKCKPTLVLFHWEFFSVSLLILEQSPQLLSRLIPDSDSTVDFPHTSTNGPSPISIPVLFLPSPGMLSFPHFSWLKHFLESESHSVVPNCLWPQGLYSPWNSPGQNTGVGSLSLLQGIFPTQGLNPGLPHCRQILYQLSHQGSPRILEWAAYPFSSRSSQPRNRTGVSFIAGGFITNWDKREALSCHQSFRTQCKFQPAYDPGLSSSLSSQGLQNISLHDICHS